MIGHLSGTIVTKTARHVIVDVQGVGYTVYLSEPTLLSGNEGDTVQYWIHTAVRENAIDLFGFTDESEVRFFEMLLDVSGIGPRSALGIVGIASLESLKQAIANNDTSYLTKVSGIGKRIAEKIVVELKDKLADYLDTEGESNGRQEESEALEALEALGYNATQAREALKSLSPKITGTGERVKAVLQIIGK
jgi:Holliday junction DNA helicase RuvA